MTSVVTRDPAFSVLCGSESRLDLIPVRHRLLADPFLIFLPSATMEPDVPTAGTSGSEKKKPIVIITIGMAGAGKSTFVQRINSYLHSQNKPPYVLNLDPAVANTPFEANIDIRDTVDYHKVMKECVSLPLRKLMRWLLTSSGSLRRYNLGPNGGILTALNLFTTKFDQVLDLVEKRAETVE